MILDSVNCEYLSTQLAMRVSDKNLPNTKLRMPKKNKKKQQRKRSDRKETVDESSDDGRPGRCNHLNKATNLNSMRKALRQQRVVGRCIVSLNYFPN